MSLNLKERFLSYCHNIQVKHLLLYLYNSSTMSYVPTMSDSNTILPINVLFKMSTCDSDIY